MDDDSRGIQIISEKKGDYAGLNLSTVGDFNGDGFDDIIYSNSGVTEIDEYGAEVNSDGMVYLVFGSASPGDLDLTNIVTVNEGEIDEYEALSFYGLIIDGIHETSELAAKITNVGDVDGDGFDDLLVGEYFVDESIDPAKEGEPTRSYTGATYSIYGGDLIPELATITLVGDGETGNGTPVTDRFVGLDGVNVFNVIEGSDRVSSGAGDDGITVEDFADVLDLDEATDMGEDLGVNENSFMILDGGSGKDTLIIDVGGVDLDLTSSLTNLKL